MKEELDAAVGHTVSRETFERLETYAFLLREESSRQNLIASSTLDGLWRRHILDSAQLVRFGGPGGAWADIGSGAGLPGIVVACIVDSTVTLIEPRRLRAEFLHKVIGQLRINARVEQKKAEAVAESFDVITARAVAPLSRLLEISAHLSTTNTRWILPKGRSPEDELAQARAAWHGVFHVERSVTDDESFIIVATDVRARR